MNQAIDLLKLYFLKLYPIFYVNQKLQKSCYYDYSAKLMANYHFPKPLFTSGHFPERVPIRLVKL